MTISEVAPRYSQFQSSGSAPSNGSRTADDASSKAQQLVRTTVLAALGVKSAAPGARGIAEAIRNGLAAAGPNAPDPVPALLQTINGALDNAARSLADQGLDPATIDAALKRFRSELAREFDGLAQANAVAPAASPPTTALAAHAVLKEKLSLDILTTEGDRVSIRFRIKDVIDVAAAQATGDAGTATAVDLHVISRGRLKIEVIGNLNDAELKAIGDLLDKVDALATQFFGGDVQAAFAAAANLGSDSTQIAGFDLRLTYSRAAAFAAIGTTIQAATTPHAPRATQPPPATQPPAPAQGATPPAATAQSTPPASIDNTQDTSTSTPATTPAAAPAQAPTAQQTLTNFIKEVLAQLGSVSGAGRVNFSLRWKVDFLLTALLTDSPSADATPSSSTSVLGDTLHNASASSR